MTKRTFYPIDSLGKEGGNLILQHPNRHKRLAFYMNPRTFREALIDLHSQDGRYVINKGYGHLGRFGPETYIGPDNTPVYERISVPDDMFEIDFR